MKLWIKSNRCEGWHQPHVMEADGSIRKGARWPTWQQAYDALVFFSKHRKSPSEVEEHEVRLCEACGQPLPEESK